MASAKPKRTVAEKWRKGGKRKPLLGQQAFAKANARPRLMSFCVHLATLKVVESPEEFAYQLKEVLHGLLVGNWNMDAGFACLLVFYHNGLDELFGGFRRF